MTPKPKLARFMVSVDGTSAGFVVVLAPDWISALTKGLQWMAIDPKRLDGLDEVHVTAVRGQ